MSELGNKNQQLSGEQGGNSQVQQAIERFKALPKGVQITLVVVFVIMIMMALSGRGGQEYEELQGPVTTASINTVQQAEEEKPFEGLETDRPALMQRWLQTQQQSLSTMQEDIEQRFMDLQDESAQDRAEMQSLRNDIQQMLGAFREEVSSIRSSNEQDREMLSQLADETRRLQLQSPVRDGGSAPAATLPRRSQRISQTPLGGGSGGGNVNVDSSKALFGALGMAAQGKGVVAGNGANANVEPAPFLPPLGFIKATMLNGVDAIAGGGQATPSLVRLSGVYKTAMNSSVNLNGCFALVEFEGDISTERAMGKPSRMTCVTEDGGATTYDVNGYVVDREDGIIGVPGVFYEGDPKRIAAAMIADFAAGVAEVIEENQKTTTQDSQGNKSTSITGDQSKAEIAGGASKAIGSMRDFLMEKAARILPFVRIDSTRDIHIVLLSGVELDREAGAWTQLFDGTKG